MARKFLREFWNPTQEITPKNECSNGHRSGAKSRHVQNLTRALIDDGTLPVTRLRVAPEPFWKDTLLPAPMENDDQLTMPVGVVCVTVRLVGEDCDTETAPLTTDGWVGSDCAPAVTDQALKPAIVSPRAHNKRAVARIH